MPSMDEQKARERELSERCPRSGQSGRRRCSTHLLHRRARGLRTKQRVKPRRVALGHHARCENELAEGRVHRRGRHSTRRRPAKGANYMDAFSPADAATRATELEGPTPSRDGGARSAKRHLSRLVSNQNGRWR